jgi:predicted ribosomally synthesized peptide with SipW-like signal peptide
LLFNEGQEKNMMKIFKSLAIITAVVAIAGGGTYALWTDSATITGSTFSAGTMNLKIDKNPVNTGYEWVDNFNINDVTGLPTDLFKNLYPGYPANNEHNWQVIDIMEVDGQVPNSVATIKLEKTSGSNELADNLRFRVYFDANNDGFKDGEKTALYDAPLSGYTGVYELGKITGAYENTGDTVGRMASVKIEWYVPTSAGNDIQGKSLTINTVLGLQQK